MTARHRRPVPPRRVNKRVVGAGASGLAVVFAVVPFANAEEPIDSTTSSAPASGTPTSDAPTSDAPSSESPTSDVPTSDAPASNVPTSDAPTSDAPTTDAPSSDAPSSDAPSSDAPSAGTPVTTAPSQSPSSRPPAKQRLVPDFGRGKETDGGTVTVRVEQAQGSSVPDGASTAGSVVTVEEKNQAGAVVSTTECTTVADPAPSNGSACEESFVVAPFDTITLTQTSAAPHFVVAPPRTAGPYSCYDPQFSNCPDVIEVTETLYDSGLAPVVTAPSTTVTVPADTASDVDVDESQVDTDGNPPTSVDVTTDPAHGTVTVVSDAPPERAARATAVSGAFHFVYTPTADYVGPDSFAYTVSTANGTSAVAVVDLRVVGAAPTANDDTASTKQGVAITDDVLANDTANGGGTLTLDAVTEAQHGNAEIVDGRVRYTPAPDFTGTDTFGYSVSTYSGTATATVTVSVTAAATATPTPTPAPTTSSSNGAAPADDNVTTADTGTPSAALLEIGGALLLAGAGATVIGRRRRPTGGHV